MLCVYDKRYDECLGKRTDPKYNKIMQRLAEWTTYVSQKPSVFRIASIRDNFILLIQSHALGKQESVKK
jgi:ABC-type lipopolysaccharide export system ATPase subunit